MSTTRKLAGNSIAQIVSKIVSTGLGFAAFVILADYLGTVKFGWFSTAVIFLQFIGILTDFGLTPVTSKLLSEPNVDEKKVLQNLLSFRLITAVGAYLLAGLLVWVFPYPPEVKFVVSFMTVSFVAIAINQVLIGFFQTILKAYLFAIAEVASRIFLIVALVLFIRADAAFTPLMIIVTLASVLYTLVNWFFARRYASLSLRIDAPIWKLIVKTTWPIGRAILFNTLY